MGWALQFIGFGLMFVNFQILTATHRWHQLLVSLPLVVFAAAAGCFGRVMYLNRRNESLVSRGACHACGYTLTTGMHTCPECGEQRQV